MMLFTIHELNTACLLLENSKMLRCTLISDLTLTPGDCVANGGVQPLNKAIRLSAHASC